MLQIMTSALRRAPRGTLARAGRLSLIAWLGLVILPVRSAHAQPSTLVILTSVQVVRDGPNAIVTLEADGPLPTPTTGVVDSPPRFFLDFPGVIAGTRGTAGDGRPLVSRVRVALHTASPAVTRVVIDLIQPQPVQVDGAASAAGRMRIIVRGTGRAVRPEAEAPKALEPQPQPAALLPVPPLPPDPAAAHSKPVQTTAPPLVLPEPRRSTAEPPPATPPPASTQPGAAPPVYEAGPSRTGEKPAQQDLDRYRDQVAVPLGQMRTRRTLLTLIDQQEQRTPEGLSAARAEFSAVIRALAGVRPVESMLPTHDVLVRAASLALMAVTLRDDAGGRADPTALRNASSAAAGALLLVDRVCIEIGCGPLAERK
jgi:hypothetical protein